jgi:Transmembrane amino acid transporter protein
MLGSLSIAVNSILGPAMLSLPATFVKSGLIPTTATLLFVCFLSSFCSLNLANTISRVPGNANFKKEVEYSEAFRHFLGQRWFYFTQIIFFSCVTCLNISSIVDTANVVDTFFGHWWPWGGTAAIRVYMDSHHESGETIKLEYWDYSLCSSAELQDGLCLPFRSGHGHHQDAQDAANSLLFTLGSLVTTLIFLPLALLDLKENAVCQILGFIIAIIISCQFIIQFAFADTLVFARVPLWGSEWTDLMGVVLFNFALVIAVPAWLYEREPHVDIPTVVHGSNFISCFLYVSVGLLGAVAMPNVSDNMLESMMSGLFGTFLQLGASIFAFFIIGLGSPLFSVLTRLNLMGSGLCSRTTGNLMAVYFPFAMAWLLYNGSAITALLSWGGVIFSSLVVFILPSALTLYVVQKYDYQGTVSVYYGKFTSKPQEIITSRVILAVTAASVVVALVGLVFASSS